jgi:SAM-dependent methyltransferase
VAYRAVHLPGGNHFDDVRLDLSASYAEQDRWLAGIEKTSAARRRFRTGAARALYRVEPYRVREALVNAGLRRRWFEEFREYWESVLQGRPLTVLDFHNLRFAYRLRAQTDSSEQLSWERWEDHLANWQQPQHLFQTFEFVYRSGLHPAWEGTTLFALLKPGWRVLEYGCSIAPMYRTWRTFLGHVSSRWVLADIPGFAFHYARHLYGPDAEVTLATVQDADDPLRGVEEPFDLIIAQAVFEHLDRPRHLAEYLLERLRPQGFLWLEYSITDATGLDTPAGQAERLETLRYLSERLDVVQGELRVDERSLGTTICRKRAS